MAFPPFRVTWLVNTSDCLEVQFYNVDAGMQLYHKDEVNPDGSLGSMRGCVDCDRQAGLGDFEIG